MDNVQNANITILTCQAGKKATKQFFAQPNGAIEKRQFSAGVFFNRTVQSVSSLDDLANVLETLLDEPEKLVIRGNAKPAAGSVVRRKMTEPEAGFDSCARPYVMLDIDKQMIPTHFDVIVNPKEVIAWVQQMLPAPFRGVSCYYKFSSSQNVPSKVNDKASSMVSVHLWFWLDRPISDNELKRYFKANPAPVDMALFSPVQIHYTARPLFHGMDDPLPNRSGILRGSSDVVCMPEIPALEERSVTNRPANAPVVTQADCDKAIEILKPYYKEGVRDRLCGAIAGALYRGGWVPESAASFVYDLADAAGDADANGRYSSALRICDAIENNRRAQGIPTLKDELKIKELDTLLELLSIKNPEIKSAVLSLLDCSDINKIADVVSMLTGLSEAEQKSYLEQIRTLTKQPKSVLKQLLQDAIAAADTLPPIDCVDQTMESFLAVEFAGGRNLLRADDGRYWRFSGTHWEPTSEDAIRQVLLPYVRETVLAIDGKRGAAAITNEVMVLLRGRVYLKNSPLHGSGDMPMVINCLNGELWFDDQGEAMLRPHLPESYLKHCLDVCYNPAATSPMFDATLLEIFSKSSDPEDMARHFLELGGYICQQWRKLAIIVLLYGYGSNGKSSLMSLIQRVLGHKAVMSDRISDIEGNVFKIGALDGKLLLMDDDVDEGTCLPDGFLKKISEEKMLSGQHKHKDPFEFICRVVPVMSANAYPSIKDLSTGLRRRMMIIPFDRHFKKEEVQPSLFNQIWAEEAPGVLNKLIRGFGRVKRRGGFLEPADCVAAKQVWLSRSNVLPAFIQECCQEGADLVQPLGDFYVEFKSYCEENGTRNMLTQMRLGQRLEMLGYDVTELNGKKVVRGLQASSRAFTGTAPDLRLDE